MNELIKITESNGKKTVSARDLHLFLESKKDFSSWIKHRIQKYGLIETIDFVKLTQMGEPDIHNVNPKIEYALTIDAAKELAMVEGNEKGKQARQYFIECEKKLIAIPENNRQVQEILQQAQLLLQSVTLSVANTKAIEIIEKKIESIEQRQLIEIKQDYFSILAYCRNHNIQITFYEATQKGRLASKLSKEKGFEIRDVPDERFGHVHSYKEEILKQTFQL